MIPFVKVDISSNDEEDFNSEADVGEEVQQVNQPIGNDQNQERPEARGQPANQPVCILHAFEMKTDYYKSLTLQVNFTLLGFDWLNCQLVYV